VKFWGNIYDCLWKVAWHRVPSYGVFIDPCTTIPDLRDLSLNRFASSFVDVRDIPRTNPLGSRRDTLGAITPGSLNSSTSRVFDSLKSHNYLLCQLPISHLISMLSYAECLAILACWRASRSCKEKCSISSAYACSANEA